MSRCNWSISEDKPVNLTLWLSIVAPRTSRSVCASCSNWSYCSKPKRAACDLSFRSTMRWRRGSSRCSILSRSSLLARKRLVKSSYSLRLADNRVCRSTCNAKASCNPARAVVSLSKLSSSCCLPCSAFKLVICCAAVSWVRCNSC